MRRPRLVWRLSNFLNLAGYVFELTDRQLQPEMMDDPRLDPGEHQRALRALERVQRLSGTAGRMWTAIKGWYDATQPSRVTVMDVGCGNAVLLRSLWHRAQKHQLPIELIGCDFSSHALTLAKSACDEEHIPIQLHQVDVTREPLPRQADVVVCSLFLHHFSGEQVIEILRQFATAAEQLVLVEDLIRSHVGYALCGLGVQLLTRSRVVHYDGLQSVRAAFTLPEMQQLLDASGFRGVRMHKHWPERLFVEYRVTEEFAGVAHA